MIKFIKILCLTFILSVAALAQTNTDEYKKNEYYVGYSNQQVDSGSYRTLNGFEGAYVRNVHRYFGIKADVSGAYRKDSYSIAFNDSINGTYSYTGKYKTSVYNFMVGAQIKDNTSKKRLKPFAHVLVGLNVNRYKNDPLICTSGTCPSFITNTSSFTFNDKNFTGAIGGGLDIKINDRIDFRAIQVDYNPIFTSGTQHNVRFGVGFVFK